MPKIFGDGLGIATSEAQLVKYVPTPDGGFTLTIIVNEGQNPAWFQELRGRNLLLVAVAEDCHDADAVNNAQEAIDYVQTKR